MNAPAKATKTADWARSSGVIPRAAFPDPMLGAEVGGVLVQRVVAKGGVGMVYAGEERTTGRPAAVKVLRSCHAHDVGITSRFLRETEFALRIRHQNLVEVMARGTLGDGRPY